MQLYIAWKGSIKLSSVLYFCFLHESRVCFTTSYRTDFEMFLSLLGTVDIDSEENCMETDEQFLLQPAETNTRYVYVNTRVDYQYRSASLDSMCLYDYISFYRKKPIDAKDRQQLKGQLEANDTESRNPRRGRPVSERENFLVGHPQVASHINIKRMNPVVPILLGPPIPRKDRDDTKERYCRSILTLFFPWRSVQDICDVDQTWEQAFQIRQTRILPISWKIIDNIQLLQECKNDRDEHLQQVIQLAQTETGGDNLYPTYNDSDTDDDNTELFDVLEAIDMTEMPAVKELGSRVEQIYFEKTVQAVDKANRFANIRSNIFIFKIFLLIIVFIDSRIGYTNHFTYTSKVNKNFISDHRHLVPATTELIALNNKWQRIIKDERDRRRNACIVEQLEHNFIIRQDNIENELVGTVDDRVLFDHDSHSEPLNFNCIIPVTKITIPDGITRENIAQQFTLNKNQKAAFMIITGHLDGLDKLNAGIILENH